ncbi:MAG TPA: lysophospholipid acyltransferase family protein [Ignavibacteriaceae bacterium]|nr:lysophospholipid acyltransferase family protein [Ignavibacteriaceae bacterium]
MITAIKIFFLAIFTIICSVLAVIVSVFDRTFFLYFKLTKIFSTGILWISGIKLKISGLENFSPKQTYVFVSNHSSQYDIVTLQKAIPNRMSIVFKRELAKIPIFGWQLYTGPYVMIDRKNPESALQSIDEAKKLMSLRKISIVVYAEGTRSLSGEIQQFKRGAFRLASQVGYPIVPVSICGSNKIMPKGTFKLKSGIIDVHFDRPISTENIKSRQDEIELMNKVREVIIKNQKNV